MPRKIEYTLETGYSGCSDHGEMEVDDNATDEEINQMIWEMAQEHGVSWEGDERLMDEDEWQSEYGLHSFYEGCEGYWKFIA